MDTFFIVVVESAGNRAEYGPYHEFADAIFHAMEFSEIWFRAQYQITNFDVITITIQESIVEPGGLTLVNVRLTEIRNG